MARVAAVLLVVLAAVLVAGCSEQGDASREDRAGGQKPKTLVVNEGMSKEEEKLNERLDELEEGVTTTSPTNDSPLSSPRRRPREPRTPPVLRLRIITPRRRTDTTSKPTACSTRTLKTGSPRTSGWPPTAPWAATRRATKDGFSEVPSAGSCALKRWKV
jgi:hypothetical protein